MSSLTEYAENYVNNALKQQSSSDKNEKKQLQKQMDKSRKNYIDKYISGRQLPFKKKGILNSIEKKVREDFIPILGICLGMQMMLQRSDEGKQEGLGWINGEVKKFRLNETKT